MIEPLLASKNLCNLADVLKYPPSNLSFGRNAKNQTASQGQTGEKDNNGVNAVQE